MRTLAAFLAVTCVAVSAADLELVRRDGYLMGTRAQLAVYAADADSGLAILERALQILERTERQLTTWSDQSEVSRLNRTPIGTRWQAMGGLCGLFGELFAWHEVTEGLFDPAVGALAAAWKIHDGGTVPGDPEIEAARQRSGMERITFNADDCTLTRHADVTIDVGAFGKGEALDRVSLELPDIPWMIDLGGHISVGAPHPTDGAWAIDIAHPLERGQPVMSVRMHSGSLATSGTSERDLDVNGARVGHILDPRTGRPAAFRGSVVVWHEQALAADVLSTALYVMGPDAGLRWAKERELAVCYLIPNGGSVERKMTDAFERLVSVHR